jgi:hypothetical protein
MSSKTETKAPDLSSACLSPLRLAAEAGLTQGRKTKHINAKVTPALYAAAARRVGSDSPAKVVEAALASLATRDGIGPWLASQWGVLADVDPEILEQLTF